jgi:transcriptional regulator with XRE-family HTH domain
MTATDAQVRIAMRERKKGKSQEQAAAKANLRSRKTVSKYEQSELLPSQLEKPRTYRTRPDAFAEEWPTLERMLTEAPELEAKTLFDWLCEQQPDKYQEGQLRTLQRRVTNWRALNQAQMASLDQVREPGEMMQLDGTWMTELGVTIEGQPFKHMLIHCVLPYSNWEWGRVAQSESLSAVRLGLQSALLKLGHMPRLIQTDNSSAATRRLRGDEAGRERAYTDEYLALLAHYGLTPQTIHLGASDENGDVESSNGKLKRSVAQQLWLRGSRDFAGLAVYESFLFDIMDKRNKQRQLRLSEELAVMRPLLATPLANHSKQRVRVSRGSLIRVLEKTYSVPTSLIGKMVTVVIHEWSLEIYYAGQLVDRFSRLIGNDAHQVNYRHVIDSLLRKPGGFRRYRYRDDLFPSLIFRQAWEALDRQYAPRRADLTYLRILHLAARHLECDVAVALELLLASGQRWSEADVAELLRLETAAVPVLAQPVVELRLYDQLLIGDGAMGGGL